MSKNTVLRLVVYIRALGAEPIPPTCNNYKEYSMILQAQYVEVWHQRDVKEATRLRSIARATIRKLGLIAASKPVPKLQPSPARGKHKLNRSFRKLKEFFSMPGQSVIACRSCRMGCGLPKKSWPTRESAVEAMERGSGKDKSLNIYPCPHQPGYWHVGH